MFDVPSGKLAMVVTHFEMRGAPNLRHIPAPDDVQLIHHQTPTNDWYCNLFRKIGGHDYLWSSRLEMPPAQLNTILSAPNVEIYSLQRDGRDLALLELSFRNETACELAFFGLDVSLIGTGAGRWLMNQAITLAFARPIDLFHLQTCTLDSAQAMGFYQRSGFKPVRQQIEIKADPRITGALPRSAAPRIPIFE